MFNPLLQISQFVHLNFVCQQLVHTALQEAASYKVARKEFDAFVRFPILPEAKTAAKPLSTRLYYSSLLHSNVYNISLSHSDVYSVGIVAK